MVDNIRLTAQTRQVISAFSNEGSSGLSGSEICKSTGLPSGTLYPILLRLEKAGWLVSKWEEGNPTDMGRPRKRLYSLTGAGVRAAQSIAREFGSLGGALIWT